MKQSDFNFILRQLNMASEMIIMAVDQLKHVKVDESPGYSSVLRKLRGTNVETNEEIDAMLNASSPSYYSKSGGQPEEKKSKDTIKLRSGVDDYKSVDTHSNRKEPKEFHQDTKVENFRKRWAEDDVASLEDFMKDKTINIEELKKYFGRSEASIRTMMSVIRKMNSEAKTKKQSA